jgi:hypothetical protein
VPRTGLGLVAIVLAAAACAAPPIARSSTARPTPLAFSAIASDSLDVLQCAQRIGANAGFFPEDREGTSLVRRPLSVQEQLSAGAPVRRVGVGVPGTSDSAIQSRNTRQVRILLRPRIRNEWLRVNARAPGTHTATMRDLVQLINARCALHMPPTAV